MFAIFSLCLIEGLLNLKHFIIIYFKGLRSEYVQNRYIIAYVAAEELNDAIE